MTSKVRMPYLPNMLKKDSYILSDEYEAENDIFYLKLANNLNELIGSRLANIMHIPTAEYQLVKKDNNIYYRSQSFTCYGYNYYRFQDLYKTFKKDIFNIEELPVYYNFKVADMPNLIKVLALDIYMRQEDRSYNMLFQAEDIKKEIALAPLLDYSSSFSTMPFKEYSTPFFDIKMTPEDIEKRLGSYSQMLKESLLFLSDLDLLKIVSKIIKHYQLEAQNDVFSFYDEAQNRSHELIKTIL